MSFHHLLLPEKDHGFLKFYYLTKKYKHITVGRSVHIKPTDSEVNHKNIFLSIFKSN